MAPETLCEDCHVHQATIKFSPDGAIGDVHGFTREICLCCYHKHVGDHLQDVKENYKDVHAQLTREGCK